MDNSRILLSKAIQALEEAEITAEVWEVGGGTVLAHYFNHRLSKDIDIFLNDPQMLSVLSPRFNNVTEEALDYDEMTNYISLTYPEGKIDFIISPQITSQGVVQETFFGHQVNLESPIEIVIKKIFHRGDQVLPRDLFDLAAVYTLYNKELLKQELLKIEDAVTRFFEKVKHTH